MIFPLSSSVNGVEANFTEHFLAAVTLLLAWLVTTLHTENYVTITTTVGWERIGFGGTCQGRLVKFVGITVEDSLQFFTSVCHFEEKEKKEKKEKGMKGKKNEKMKGKKKEKEMKDERKEGGRKRSEK